MSIDIATHRKEFDRHDLSLADWFVLSIPGLWPLPRESVVKFASGQSEGDPRGHVGVKQCFKSLDRLLERGWLQVVTRSELRRLRKKVEISGAVGPMYGYPKIGYVDFTEDGAAQFLELIRVLYGPGWFSKSLPTIQRRDRIEYYTAIKALAAKKARQALANGMAESVSPLGPWCIYWWNTFPSGWKITIDRKANRPD